MPAEAISSCSSLGSLILLSASALPPPRSSTGAAFCTTADFATSRPCFRRKAGRAAVSAAQSTDAESTRAHARTDLMTAAFQLCCSRWRTKEYAAVATAPTAPAAFQLNPMRDNIRCF